MKSKKHFVKQKKGQREGVRTPAEKQVVGRVHPGYRSTQRK
jgi:hypothetical protein